MRHCCITDYFQGKFDAREFTGRSNEKPSATKGFNWETRLPTNIYIGHQTQDIHSSSLRL